MFCFLLLFVLFCLVCCLPFGGEQIASRLNYQRIVSVYWIIYLVFICSSLFGLHLPSLFLCKTGANLFLASPGSRERPPGQRFIFVQRRAASRVRAIFASKKMSPVRHCDEWQSPTTEPGFRLNALALPVARRHPGSVAPNFSGLKAVASTTPPLEQPPLNFSDVPRIQAVSSQTYRTATGRSGSARNGRSGPG